MQSGSGNDPLHLRAWIHHLRPGQEHLHRCDHCKHSPQLWKTPSELISQTPSTAVEDPPELISQTLSTAVEDPLWTDVPNNLHSCGRPPLNWCPKHSPQLWKTPSELISQTLSTAVEDPRWTDIPNTLHSCGRPPLNRCPKHSPQLWKTPSEQMSQTLSTAVEDPRWTDIPNTLHSCGRPPLNWCPKHSPQLWKTPLNRYPKHSPQLWKTPSEQISQTVSTAVEDPRWTDIPNILHSCGRPPLNRCPKHSPQLWKTPSEQMFQTLSTAVEDPLWTDVPNTLHSCGRPPLNRCSKHSPQLWKTPSEQMSQTLSTAVEDPLNLDVFVCTANSCILWNDDVITPRLDPSHVTATTTWTNTEQLYFYELTLTQISKCIVPCSSCRCVWFVGSAQGLRACSLYLVYLCGGITAPYTGLACILHRFVSVSCVPRYKRTLWVCVDEPLIYSGSSKWWVILHQPMILGDSSQSSSQ